MGDGGSSTLHGLNRLRQTWISVARNHLRVIYYLTWSNICMAKWMPTLLSAWQQSHQPSLVTTSLTTSALHLRCRQLGIHGANHNQPWRLVTTSRCSWSRDDEPWQDRPGGDRRDTVVGCLPGAGGDGLVAVELGEMEINESIGGK